MEHAVSRRATHGGRDYFPNHGKSSDEFTGGAVPITLRLSYLVCPSGLGHLSRTTAVVNHLMAMGSNFDFTLHLAAWQVTYAQKWLKNSDICMVPADVPFVSTPEGRMAWTENALADTEFDILVSDNLMEAIMFHEKLALVGSFLWDYYDNNFWKDPLWLKANEMKTPIFGLEFFAMPSVRALSGFKPVGLIGNCGKRELGGDEILFSFGRSNAAKELCNLVRDTICPNGKPRGGIIFDDVKNCEPVGDYSAAFFSRFSCAVIRPGIGTVSDCLRYGVPIVILHEDGNDEMEWNTKILLKNGFANVAKTVDEALMAAHAWADETRRLEFHKIRQTLRWEGEKEIAAGIINYLEKKQ